MKNNKIIGFVFSIIALVFIVIFILRIDFSIQLESYFSLKYYFQYTPIVISFLLFFSGVFLIRKHRRTNFILALFGFDVLEELTFNWFGLTTSLLPTFAMGIFLCLAIVSMWVAFTNPFNLNKISYKEVISSIVIGAILSLMPYYF